MKVLVVLAHQQQGSFNHAIAQTAVDQLRKAGHEVIYHDLYAEHFDPILPASEVPKTAPVDPGVRRHCGEIRAVDGYVVVHPNWWGQPPAILKGWLDRVFRQGVAYEFGPAGVIEHLKGRRAVVFTTSNTPRDLELQLYGDPLENLWKNCVFALCGVRDFVRRNFEPVIVSTLEQRQAWLAEVRQLIAQRFPAQG
jgi:putative NADPH-quinone reductase